MNSPKNNCLNCGKNGHIIKQCNEPIISYGLICFNINPMLNISTKSIDKFLHNKFLDIDEFNLSNLNNINIIPEFYNNIKILMVRRKHSLNYIEFIRGKYDTPIDIQRMFELMTQKEVEMISTLSFDTLWNDLWNETSNYKIYMKEYTVSKNKFNELKKNNFNKMLNSSVYNDAEWGFPKGRRNMNENNLSCAIREFNEETNIDMSMLNIIERLNCIKEDIIGSNLKKYRHIYYLANSENEFVVSSENVQMNEIGDIGWFTIPEAIEKIRPYNVEKIKIIHQIYFFIINLIVGIKNNNNVISL